MRARARRHRHHVCHLCKHSGLEHTLMSLILSSVGCDLAWMMTPPVEWHLTHTSVDGRMRVGSVTTSSDTCSSWFLRSYCVGVCAG